MGQPSPETGRPADIRGTYNQALKALELILRPVDEQGKKLTKKQIRSGMTGESWLTNIVGRTREAALEGDPALKSLYDEVMGGIQGDPSELPPDMQQNLLQSVRGSQAARGVLDSDTSGIQEAVELLGGREQIRAHRLQQANALLSGGLVPSASMFLPSANDMIGASAGLQGLKIQRLLGAGGLGVGGINSIGNVSAGLGQLLQGAGSYNSSIGL